MLTQHEPTEPPSTHSNLVVFGVQHCLSTHGLVDTGVSWNRVGQESMVIHATLIYISIDSEPSYLWCSPRTTNGMNIKLQAGASESCPRDPTVMIGTGHSNYVLGKQIMSASSNPCPRVYIYMWDPLYVYLGPCGKTLKQQRPTLSYCVPIRSYYIPMRPMCCFNTLL